MKIKKSAFWLLPQYPNFAFLGRYFYGFKQKTISKLTMVHKVFGNVYSLSIGLLKVLFAGHTIFDEFKNSDHL